MAQPDDQTPPVQPTPAEAAAVAAAGGEAAANAAEAGKTPEQAQAETVAAMAAKTKADGVALTDDDCNKIAEATIKLLEARGAFEQAPASGQPAAPSTPPAEGSAAQTAAGADTGQSSTSPPPAPSSPPSEEPPRKRTFAERFQGKR